MSTHLLCRVNQQAMVLLGALVFISGASVPVSHAADAKLHQRLLNLKSLPGNDHRKIVDSTQAPWRAVGRLNNRLGSHCTATVIAPKRLLTAAHCLWNKRTGKYLPPQSLHFVAGWSKGDYLFDSKITAIHPAPNYAAQKPGSMNAFTHDWAIVDLLDDPVPVTGLIRPVGFGKSPFQARKVKAGPYIQAGYSADKRHVLTAHAGCAIWGIDPKRKLALHSCNALPGDSGSPIIVEGPDKRFRLVSIHVGYAATKGGGLGIAVPSSTFLDAIKRLN